MSSKRAEGSPVCAYLMDINFPYNVSSQWDPDDSSCVSALGESCVSSLSAARMTGNCDTSNAPLVLFNNENCEGMLRGGPGMADGILTQGLRMYSPASCFSFTAPANLPPQRSMLVMSATERGHTPSPVRTWLPIQRLSRLQRSVLGSWC